MTPLKPKTDEDVNHFRERAARIVKKHSEKEMIKIKVKFVNSQQKRYTSLSRPTPLTKYELIKTLRDELNFKVNQSILEENLAGAIWRIYALIPQASPFCSNFVKLDSRDEWLVERSFHRLSMRKIARAEVVSTSSRAY